MLLLCFLLGHDCLCVGVVSQLCDRVTLASCAYRLMIFPVGVLILRRALKFPNGINSSNCSIFIHPVRA